MLPPFYGDALRDYETQPTENLSLTKTQYHYMKQWKEGNFIPPSSVNGEPLKVPPQTHLPPVANENEFESLSLRDQTFALNKAALGEVLGGPFRPGIEITWVLRVGQMWKDLKSNFCGKTLDELPRCPIRLNQVEQAKDVKDSYGPKLTPEIALMKDGPVHKSGPGTLTRWMGVPWQVCNHIQQ